MKIEDLDKLKFTRLKYNGRIINFKYDGISYTLVNGYSDGWTEMTELYKGKELIGKDYGFTLGLIKYIGNKQTPEYIDKENFVFKLIQTGILEPSEEQEPRINKKRKEEIQKKINELKKELIFWESQL